MRKWMVAAGAAVAMMAGAATAHAGHPEPPSYGAGFVDGAGTVTDDWGEHFSDIGNSLCHGCANSWNTDTVILWQAVLVAEGLLPHSGIDGKYGPNTAAATRSWQAQHGLSADGWVGDNTWGRADDHLQWNSTGNVIDFRGSNGYIVFFRGDSSTNRYDGGRYNISKVWTEGGSITYFDGDTIFHTRRSLTIE